MPKANAKTSRASEIISPWPLLLSVITVCALAAAGVVSDVDAYLRSSDGLDFLLLAAALGALAVALVPFPKYIAGVGFALLGYVAVVFLSLKNTWAGTDLMMVLRSVATIVLSASCLIVGAALRNRAVTRPSALKIVQIVAVVLCCVIMAVAIVKPAATEKNVLGGLIFEVSMLYYVAGYARGETGWRPLVMLSVLVTGGAIITGHRLMMAIGVGVPIGIAGLRLLWFSWSRIVPIFLAISIGVGAIVVYTQYENIEQFSTIDAQVKQETGRSMLSGRQQMWGTIVEAIFEAPQLGYGPTIKASDVTGLNWSTHNAFLNVGLQSGVIGLATVFIVFFALAGRTMSAPIPEAGAILSMYIAGVIIHNSFENVLFTNKVSIAVLTWTNIGFLVASCSIAPAKIKPKPQVSYASPSVKVRVRDREG